MAPSTFFARKSAVRDLEKELLKVVLVADLGSEQVVSEDGLYRLQKILGRGGSAVVCRAIWTKFEIDVALKLYPAEEETTPDVIRSEAQSIAKLKHINIVRVHDYGELTLPEGIRCHYVAMELLEGELLRTWLARVPSPAAILKVFASAGEGLGYAHSKGCVHRDFKPENVMLVEGEPKIVDFGLAQGLAARVAESCGEDSAGRRTIVGTLAFLAPEVLRGEEADPASDQFAFAAALWEALFHEFPYAIDSIDPERRSQRPQRPERAHKVSPQLLAALYRALDADRRARFISMYELVEELRRALPGFVMPSVAEGAGASDSMPLLENHHNAVSSEAITVNYAPVRSKSRRRALFFAGGLTLTSAVAGMIGADLVDPSQLAEVLNRDTSDAVDEEGGESGERIGESGSASIAVARPAAVQARLELDSPCAAEGVVAGRWSFTTGAIWASRPSWRWPRGTYELVVELGPHDCAVQLQLVKHSPRDQGQGHRRAEAIVSLVPVAGTSGRISVELSPKRGSQSADDFEYIFDFLFDGDRLQGSFRAEREGRALFGGLLSGAREGAMLEGEAPPLACTVRCSLMCMAESALAKCRQACADDPSYSNSDCGPPPVDFRVRPRLASPQPAECQQMAAVIAGRWSAHATAENGELRHYRMGLAVEGCAISASFEGQGGGPLRMKGRIYAGDIWTLEGSYHGRVYRWQLAGAGPAFGNFAVEMPARTKKRQIRGGLAAYRIP